MLRLVSLGQRRHIVPQLLDMMFASYRSVHEGMTAIIVRGDADTDHALYFAIETAERPAQNKRPDSWAPRLDAIEDWCGTASIEAMQTLISRAIFNELRRHA